MKSNFIKLSAVTNKGANVIDQYGEVWQVSQQVDNPDTYFFQTRKPQLYCVPIPTTTRNPKENLGVNYTPSNKDANLGARWIQVDNDPDFDYFECTPAGRKL